MNPVTFSYDTWTAMFAEFAGLSAPQGQGYFNRACLICANSPANPMNGDGILATMLYLLTSHIAWLNCPRDASGNPAASGAPAAPLVGRVANASEGSVSVQVEWNGGMDASGMQAYFTQTKYGAEYWAASAPYRTARYIARPTRVPLAGGFRRWW